MRWRPLLATVVVALTAGGVWGITRIQFNDNLAEFFKADNPDYNELQQFFREFGGDDSDCIFVVRAADIFTPEAIQSLRQLTEQAATVPRVRAVHSLLDVRRPVAGIFRMIQVPLVPQAGLSAAADPAGVLADAKQRALQHPLVAGQLLSDDATTTLVLLRLSGKYQSALDVRPTVDRLHQIAAECSAEGPLDVTLTGIPPLRADIYQALQRNQIVFTTLGALVAIVIVTCLFRRPVAVLIVSVAPIVGTVWTMGLMGWFGEPINTLNSLLPALVMVVGFTDSVHFMVDIRRNRSAGKSARRAASAALRHLFLPCAMTSVTTAVGFGSLLVAKIELIQRFGAACAAGAICNFFAVVTIVPLLASTRLGTHVASKSGGVSMEARSFTFFRGVIHRIVEHAGWVTAAGCLVTAALLAMCLRLEPDNSIAESTPSDSQTYAMLRYCEKHFGGALYTYVIIEWPHSLELKSAEVLHVVADVSNLLNDEPEFGTSFSILNLLAALPHRPGRLDTALKYLDFVPAEAVERLVRRDLRKTVVSIETPDYGARRLSPMFRKLEAKLQQLQQERYPEFQLSMTGSTVVASRNINLMIVDLAKSLALACGVIFVVISIAFRSFRYGLVSILPNAIPLLTAGAVLVLRGGSLELVSVTTFSICLGIAVDDTIHFMSRFRFERRNGTDIKPAIEQSIAKVGAALLVTTLTLLGGFGAGFFSQIPAMRLFSLLSCVALVTALAADVLLLPALLTWFSHSNDEVKSAA